MSQEGKLNNIVSDIEKDTGSVGEANPTILSEAQIHDIREFSKTWLEDYSKKLHVEEVLPATDGSWGDPNYIRMDKYISDDIYNFREDVLNQKQDFTASQKAETPPISENAFDNPVATKIAELSGVSEEYRSNLLPPKQKEGVKVFFEELIQYINTIKDKSELNIFLSHLQNEMFSWSPNIFNEMSLVNQFLVTSRTNRVPEVQRWFGQEIVGEMVYELSFAPNGTTESICEKVDTLDTAEKIDVLKQCQMLGATALGDGDHARNAFLFSKRLAEHLYDDPNTLVSLIASETLSVLEEEYRNPSVGVLKVQGSKQNARLSQKLTEEMMDQNRMIESTFAVERSGIEGSVTLPISSDAVGVFDHAFDLQGVGYVEKDRMQEVRNHTEKSIGVSLTELEKIKDFFESVKKPDVNQMTQIVSFVDDVFSLRNKSCEAFNEDLDSDFSHEEFFSLFENMDTLEKIEAGIHEKRQQLMNEAGNKNYELSMKFIQQVLSVVEEYEDENGNTVAYLKDCKLEIEEALKHDDIEHAFAQAEAVALFFNRDKYLEVFNGVSDENSQKVEHHIVTKQKELVKKHGESFKNAQEDFQMYAEGVIDKLESLKDRVQETLCSDAFIDSLYEFIKEKSTEIEETRTRIDVKSIENDTVFEEEWSYLNNSSEDEKELFLRTLFDPVLRERVANDLEIDWTEIPIKSQVHFLEYLLTVDKEKYTKLVEGVKNFDGKKELLFEAFLAAQYGEEYGEVILNIAESQNERKLELLESYVSLNSVAKKVGTILGGSHFAEEIQASPEVKRMLPLQVAEAVMRRSKDILNVASEILEQGEVSVPYFDSGPVVVTSFDEVVESIQIYTGVLESIQDLLQPNKESAQFQFISKDDTAETQTYHLEKDTKDKKSYVSLQVREQGAPLGEHESDVEFDGEARINFLFSNSPMKTSLNDEARKNALSFRIDREGKKRENGNIVENDPTRKDGELSLEIGSLMHADQTLPSAVIGRVVSVGNYLGNKRKPDTGENNSQYYHNRESFTKELGDAEIFARIVGKIREAIESRFEVQ